jgi:uncharacterized protein YdcH (DUF465 family)
MNSLRESGSQSEQEGVVNGRATGFLMHHTIPDKRLRARQNTHRGLKNLPTLGYVLPMRQRWLLLLSLGVNAGLILAFGWERLKSRITPPARSSPPAAVQPAQVRTNVLVRRLHFRWDDIESEDYAAYIANLRSIGCPEATIRDIIVTEINQLFARREAIELLLPEHQWWRWEPDPEIERAATEEQRALDEERRDLLAELLGADWEANTEHPYGSLALTGPLLGSLPRQTKRAVYEINAAADLRFQAYLNRVATVGGSPDPAELARLRRQTREELARLLSAEQLEEYLLRYSQNAIRLREELRGIELEPEEFRRLFRLSDQLDERLALLDNATEPAAATERDRLLQQRKDAVQEVLGEHRLERYTMLHDPLYREAQATAQQLGASEDHLLPIYQINQVTEAERRRIETDRRLSASQRAAALQAVAEEQQKTVLQILGRIPVTEDETESDNDAEPPAEPEPRP